MSLRSIPDYTKNALEKIDTEYSEVLKKFNFYLAGGTSLALQIDHRISYDLDFFTIDTFEPQDLLARFNNNEIKDIRTSAGTVHFNLLGCSVSFFYYPYRLLSDMKLLEGYSINLANILDIGLMKITAIADRGLKKDFIDLYFIAQHLGGLEMLFSYFLKKYPESNSYHYLKGLVYFEDADTTPDLILLKAVDWPTIKGYFQNEIPKLIQ